MATSLVCVAVTGRTMDDLRRARDGVSGAGLIELRLDTVDRPDVAGALQGRTGPVIVTCRASWEGGFFRGSEEERRRILLDALAAGAEFVDVEAAAPIAGDVLAARGGRQVVLSSHVYGGVPADLPARWAALAGSPAEVVKLAVEARSLRDTADVMALADGCTRDRVLIAMGEAGAASRILSTRLGNRWTYAGDGVAPGQLPLGRLRDEFGFDRLHSGTRLYGVTGNPVMHSLSPAMHNAGFRHFGIDAVYLPLLAADAEDFIAFARRLGLAGASITAPFKVAMMDAVEEVEPLARRVGAINTLIVRNGCWTGANTDVHGFAAPLVERLTAVHSAGAAAGNRGTVPFRADAVTGAGFRATILGAGGAARAVAVALADLGAAVTVCARRPEAAREIADLAGGKVAPLPPAPGSWDVLVNATSSAGDDGEGSPAGAARLDGQIVYELLYAPPVTRLLADAQAAGLLTIGGLEMLIAQAEKQFELWTGLMPPPGLFARAAGHIRS